MGKRNLINDASTSGKVYSVDKRKIKLCDSVGFCHKWQEGGHVTAQEFESHGCMNPNSKCFTVDTQQIAMGREGNRCLHFKIRPHKFWDKKQEAEERALQNNIRAFFAEDKAEKDELHKLFGGEVRFKSKHPAHTSKMC